MRQPNGKFRYNCTIMDLFDRSAIASVNSDYINTELAIETLTEALKKEKPNNGILLHSDQGVQYTSWEFVNFCKDNGVIQSMSKAAVLMIMRQWKDFIILSKIVFTIDILLKVLSS